MAISLKDQLLKAGLADSKRARQADHARRQAAKGRSDGPDAAELVRQRQQEQAERDREANRQRLAEQEVKAVAAQIRQLIEAHRLSRQGGDQAWQYTDGKRIKKLLVTPAQQSQLINGHIAVVRLLGGAGGEVHELVPAVVAEKIRQRDASVIVQLNTRPVATAVDEDDPYKDYQIPDDLMW